MLTPGGGKVVWRWRGSKRLPPWMLKAQSAKMSVIRSRDPVYRLAFEMDVDSDKQGTSCRVEAAYICLAGVSFGERLGKGMESSAECCSCPRNTSAAGIVKSGRCNDEPLGCPAQQRTKRRM